MKNVDTQSKVPYHEKSSASNCCAQKPSSHRAIKVALVCGGPSLERGISLNSARSVLDHLSQTGIEISPYYVDVYKNFYRLSVAQLYSNTPSDFDFKLHSTAQKLTQEECFRELKEKDIVFPVIHGPFGEDGAFQELLEKEQIPFIGSDSKACKRCFGKHIAAEHLRHHGFPTLPSEVLRKDSSDLKDTIRRFFEMYHIDRAIIKPVYGGSSIGVCSSNTPDEAFDKTQRLFQTSYGDEVLIEPFCTGKEFTVIVLQNTDMKPVALIPTEIQVSYDNGGIFDYRRKYLPSANTFWFCPPRFADEVIEKIRKQAEELFLLFGMRDFARIDGWLLNDGTILFTDFNPISGMEQNSFIFQQASRIGLGHGDLLWSILSHALQREKIEYVPPTPVRKRQKEPVHVLFGGRTAERQVSLMTGTNVWLKLRKSSIYDPEPYLLDSDGTVWHLPYTFSLNHTTEEIYENCKASEAIVQRIDFFLEDIKKRLSYAPKEYFAKDHLPRKMTFEEFVSLSQKKKSFVFIGLHGGEGENGTLQQKLQNAGLLFNGSDAVASQLCMDKYRTGQEVCKMARCSIYAIPKRLIHLSSFQGWTVQDFTKYWQELQIELSMHSCVIKPRADGCSAGIVRLNSGTDLHTYVELVQRKVSFIPEGTFQNQKCPIEMPFVYEDDYDDYIVEGFIETDYIRIVKNELVHKPKEGWFELTVGVVEENGRYHALNPSITIAEGEILSVEEKFQGGTGVNLTPPPDVIISRQQVESIKRSVEAISSALKIQNYARLDIFYNVQTDVMYLIEANSLPALTPSTVLYHQALAERTPLFPCEFLESLVAKKKSCPKLRF
jgi:D-alanine--D-alanine ligase